MASRFFHGLHPQSAIAARRPGGFTLIEMMVVIGLVALLASMSLPSIVTLLNAGSDAQAYNLIAAQLTAARAKAIERVTYAGLHHQIADVKDPKDTSKPRWPKLEDVCFVGQIYYDQTVNRFRLDESLTRVPGSISLGQITTGMSAGGASDSSTMNASSESSPYGDQAGDKEYFTTFNVIFTSAGSAVKTVDGGPVRFYKSDPIFTDNPANTVITGSRQMWDYDRADNHFAATALTLFDMSKYAPLSKADRVTYLNENAQFLPLNIHTGQLFPRE